ncbi:NERD domain-containing protein [Flavobacterium tyrosinilyticum]|uniref:NERD domain-containing protein n=1 Tax=Flavobacterium tyrosinilyticum TaxID=1658740 RepID=UPI00202DEB92|nr:NERD domain-containing protein [Flavobacterium tyrosinilyticum]MCM0664535.1 NERD domain-containing protein [Flavobacterium tyrosinilyticum]
MELILLIVIFFLVFIFGFYKAKIKGIIGEKTVSSILHFLDKSDYKVIHNVVLQRGEVTTQIDHVIISSFGIFVIETKNYKGWIVGYEKSEYWTQVIYKYKAKFYNPIFQNAGHIRALKICLKEYRNLEYISVIVFSTNAKIKIDTSVDVVNMHRLLRTIKKYSTVNLSEEVKEKIFEKINASNLVDSFKKKEHINSIKQRINDREKKIQEKKCPRCGNSLVERKGEFGKFFGCKSYPKCKFTKKY